ncbi:MAG TPA: beta-ketoacyl synthase chain length factor [Kofleriaceae bacterium]|nr:beta-ketoacyl synthase chain length factor [Kofleriaceae bacterium]
MTAIPIQILGASFFATRHASADDALAGAPREHTAPAFPLLVGRARRFTSLVTQLHMEVLGALPRLGAEQRWPAVFATCHGEIHTAEVLIADLAASGMVSSAQFAHSVHNTPSGLYSIATGNPAPTTTVTGENAVAAGWLEAALVARESRQPVVLSIADEPVPAVFGACDEAGGVAAAFLVAAGDGAGDAGDASDPGDAVAARLVIGPAAAPPERTALLLARAASAAARRAADDIALGSLGAGSALRLQLDPARVSS